jgi:hypothetical protein
MLSDETRKIIKKKAIKNPSQPGIRITPYIKKVRKKHEDQLKK